MAGFLDKKTRVVDMILTDCGKELYSKGDLQFVYYTFSDDEVDYDPYISDSAFIEYTSSSGSVDTTVQLNNGGLAGTFLTSSKVEQIEATLVREAISGLPAGGNKFAKDETNIKNLLFTMPQGQKILPKVNIIPDIKSGSIETKQQLLQDSYVTYDQHGNVITKTGPFDKGFSKFRGSKLQFDMSIDNMVESLATEGYDVTVYSSGTDGLVEVMPKRDLKNAVSYNTDLRLFHDEEIKILQDAEASELKKLELSVGFDRSKKK